MSYDPHGPSGTPTYGPPPAPQPKKRKTGKIVGLGCVGVLALVVFGGCVAAMSSSSDDKPLQKSDSKDSAQPGGGKQDTTRKQSQALDFKMCVTKNGTPGEKKAVKHVTKVTGADKRNNIFDAPEVWTDFTGGLMGPHTDDAKLIASAFASCYRSDNGLVTVNGADGKILANGQF